MTSACVENDRICRMDRDLRIIAHGEEIFYHGVDSILAKR